MSSIETLERGLGERSATACARTGPDSTSPAASNDLAQGATVTNNERIDLRFGAVTQSMTAMRAAMAGAPVGDDQQDGVPSTKRLQARCAEGLVELLAA
jgi:hypothetical protein